MARRAIRRAWAPPAALVFAAGCGGPRPVPEAAPAAAAVEPAAGPALYVVGQLHRYGASGTGASTDRRTRVRWMHELRISGTRLGLDWSLIEPLPGEYRWERVDSTLADLEEAGLRSYGLLNYSPAWARPAGTGASHRPMIDGSAARGDTAFARFAATAARRFAGRVEGWEIWNEPNLPRFWQNRGRGSSAGPDGADYAALFRLAADSIRAADPAARVATGGLSPGPGPLTIEALGPQAGYSAQEFLREMVRSGLRPEIVGLHPYTARPPDGLTTGDTSALPRNPVVDSVVAVLDSYGLTDTELWITEWGVNARRASSDAERRAWFLAGLRSLLCHPRIGLVTIYTLSSSDPRLRFGLMDGGGVPTVFGRAIPEVVASGARCR